MSPAEQQVLTQLTQSSITTPNIDELLIAQHASKADAETIVSGFAQNAMAMANNISVITMASGSLASWAATLKRELDRATGHLHRTDVFTADASNISLFKPAGVIFFVIWLAVALMVGGIAIMLNTVSAIITSSGEIPSLANAPLRAALWGFIPIAGMLASGLAHDFAKRDSTKHIIVWTLISVTLGCFLIWVALFNFAFPLPSGSAAGSVNLFDGSANGQTNSSWAMWGLITVQLLGEGSFAGLIHIALVRGFTRHKQVEITPSKTYAAHDAQQHELLRDMAKAEHLTGMVADFDRRYGAAVALFEARCLGVLNEVRLRIDAARIAGTLSVIELSSRTA